MTGQEWREHAACAGTDPDRFHQDKGPSADVRRTYCAVCPVTRDCLDEALAVEPVYYRYGIWGGLTSGQRVSLHRAENRARSEGRPAPDRDQRIADALAPYQPRDHLAQAWGHGRQLMFITSAPAPDPEPEPVWCLCGHQHTGPCPRPGCGCRTPRPAAAEIPA